MATSWTRHTPAPKPGLSLDVITTDCAHCPQRIMRLTRNGGVRWVHQHDETPSDGWDTNSEKNLHESLDVVFYELDENTRPDLINALRTICSWSHNARMWNTVKKWTDEKEE